MQTIKIIRCFAGSCVAIVATFFTTSIRSEVVAEHIGSTDPVSEGWTEYRDFPGVLVGPINDAGTEAWFIDDNSPGSQLIYSKSLTASQAAAVPLYGGELTAVLRMVDGATSVHPLFATFNVGNRDFTMYLGTQPDGTGTVTLINNFGQPLIVFNSGSGYRTYQMRYDPSTATADLFVDGVERFSDYGGIVFGNFPTSPRWGSITSSNGLGQGNFSKIQFDVLPEPSAAVLFLLAGVPFIAFRRR
jgi:hypothetical protein